MSYILDALNKSDQERQEKQGPSIQTIQRPHIINKNRGGFFWLIILVFFVALSSSAFAVWFYFSNEIIKSEEKPQQKIAVQTADKPAQGVDESSETTQAQSIEKPSTHQPVLVEPKSPPPILVQFWELPNSVQKDIPALTFSFHVFSENAARRTIIINKRRAKEGELVSKYLILEEITKDGIILNWKDKYRFAINVVENW